MDVDIVTASIAAVPATLAASAAWWNASKVSKKVTTSNGHTMGQMVDINYELLKSVAHRQDEMSKSMEVHIQDQVAHCNEQHALLGINDA